MNARQFLELQEAYQGVYQELDELWKGKHGQSVKEYQAGRSDAGKRISGDENTGPRYYTLGRARGAKPDAPTAPGARPVNTPKLSRDEKEYHQYNKSGAKRRSQYNKVGGSKGLPEEVDTFDAILEHLVAEGYADTNENALAIMANMSEEWREEILDEAYQEPRFGKKDYIRKLSKRGGMGMGTPDDPHGYRDPGMAKVGAEFSKRKTAAAKARKTGEPDKYRAEKESQSKMR